jgi:hypothetical protein
MENKVLLFNVKDKMAAFLITYCYLPLVVSFQDSWVKGHFSNELIEVACDNYGAVVNF